MGMVIKKGFVFGNYEICKTPKPHKLSCKIEGAWVKHRKLNIKRWMSISWIEKVLKKHNE